MRIRSVEEKDLIHVMVIDSEQEIMTRSPGNVANSNVCKLLGNVCESLVVFSLCVFVCVRRRKDEASKID